MCIGDETEEDSDDTVMALDDKTEALKDTNIAHKSITRGEALDQALTAGARRCANSREKPAVSFAPPGPSPGSPRRELPAPPRTTHALTVELVYASPSGTTYDLRCWPTHPLAVGHQVTLFHCDGTPAGVKGKITGVTHTNDTIAEALLRPNVASAAPIVLRLPAVHLAVPKQERPWLSLLATGLGRVVCWPAAAPSH